MSWTLIESQTLGASAASVTLGSGGTIPQTYKTLKLVVSARQDAAINFVDIQFNGSGGTAYSARWLYGNGATPTSSSNGSAALAEIMLPSGSADTASTFGNAEITIPNYAGSTNKPVSADSVSENNGTTAYQMIVASLWANTAAITSIKLLPRSANFVSGSTFTLYGLK